MGTVLKALIGAMNWQQVITFIFMTAAPIVIPMVVPLPLQQVAITLAASLGALLLVIARKPSANGGTASTKPAAVGK